MTKLKNRSIAGTAAMIATMITIAAANPARAETVSIPVAYGDLDISTPAGAATLRHRIGRAADQICDVRSQADRLRSASCRNDVISTATARVAERSRTTTVQFAAR